MQRLPLNLVEPGMIVGREIVNENGIVLVSVGATLTDKIINRLENMRVRKVHVKGCPVSLADYLPKTFEEKMADMEIAFSKVAQDPLMAKFRVLVKAHFIKKEQQAKAVDGELANLRPKEPVVKEEPIPEDEKDIDATDCW